MSRPAQSPRAALVRSFVVIAVIVVVGVVVFRVILPALIDAHSDIALIGAVALGIATVAAALWLGFGLLWAVLRAFRR